MPKQKTDEVGLGADQLTILKALSETANPVAPKQIVSSTGLVDKVVSAGIKSLREKGLVDSPVRCKYAVTDLGRQELNK